MAESLQAPAARRRLRDSSWFAFGATTTALVILASGGTALLVRSGAEQGRPSQGSEPLAPVEITPSAPTTNVTVDRVVGTFRPFRPADSRLEREETSSSPQVGELPRTPGAPPAAPEPPPVVVPEPPALPGFPTPDPDQPLLPQPPPGSGQLLPIPLPLPLPDLPLLDLPLLDRLVDLPGS